MPSIDLKTILKVCVSVGLLAWVFYRVDVTELAGVLVSLPAVYLLGAAALILLQVPVLAYRWMRILFALQERQAWGMMCKATYIGIFFNQALPGSVGGDFVRIAELSGSGASLRVAANSVLLERLSGLYALVLLMVVISPLVWPRLTDPSIVIVVLGLAGLLSLAFVLLAFADRLIPRWRFLTLVKKALAMVRDDYLALLRHRRITLNILLLGGISWSLNLLAIYLLVIGAGIDIPVLACFFFGGLSILISVLPISMAGWGVREGAMVALFGLMGVAPAQAMSVSIAFGVLMLLTALPAGFLWFRRSPA